MLLQPAQAGAHHHEGLQQIRRKVPQVIAVFRRQNRDGVGLLVHLGAQLGPIGDAGGLPQILVHLNGFLLEVVVGAAVLITVLTGAADLRQVVEQLGRRARELLDNGQQLRRAHPPFQHQHGPIQGVVLHLVAGVEPGQPCGGHWKQEALGCDLFDEFHVIFLRFLIKFPARNQTGSAVWRHAAARSCRSWR